MSAALSSEMDHAAQSYWVLTGDRDNWRRGITDRLWGVVPALKSSWDVLERGDFLFFYAKAPTSGVFGTGIVRDKFRQDRPLWPDEVRKKQVLYPFRFTFDIASYIDEDRWDSESVRPDAGVPYRAGLNRIARAENAQSLLRQTERALAAIRMKVSEQEPGISRHDEIKNKLQEIGQFQSYLSETECRLNGERLDVAWRRVAASVPQKVFEMQVSGNLYSAVAKLKKAHVLWNSQPFLVLQADEMRKANELLAGPFHEIRSAVVIRGIDAVDELHTRLTQADEVRRQFGL